MKRAVFLVLFGVLLVSVVLPPDASAIPVFSRKYGFNCTMCHSNFPRLNDFGQRYRANGYRLMDREREDRTVLESPAPVAFRTSAGYNGTMYNKEAGIDGTSDFTLNSLDVLSAGLLGRDIGYLLVYIPQITGARGVTPQEGALEMASVVFSDLGCTSWLNLRVGRFEPAYVALSAKRELSVAPQEVYGIGFPDGPVWSDTQSGLELSGHGRAPLRYAVGIVDGSATNRTIDSPADVYARLACTFGPGEGQTAGQRIGVSAYLGRARPSGGLGKRETFVRIGADASLNVSVVNLAGQFVSGSDPKKLWPTATKDVTWWGALGELTVMSRTDVVGFARVDYVDMPKIQNQDITRITGGARCYFEDNVALHAEISHRIVNSIEPHVPDTKETFFTARVDLAF